jgi:hypothetical protein
MRRTAITKNPQPTTINTPQNSKEPSGNRLASLVEGCTDSGGVGELGLAEAGSMAVFQLIIQMRWRMSRGS